jgi:hypothetical protein
MRPCILLSFDVEEFDMPLEYGQAIPEEEQMRVSAGGLQRILELLDRTGVRATFFTTANFARHHEEFIRRIAAGHEIASHGYIHAALHEGDLARSKAELERITGAPVVGFRRAKMAPTDEQSLVQAGYRYDSSENPTWIPGRYNHFFAPRKPFLRQGLLHIPASATPLVRFPLFWLSFKNFPLGVIKAASRWVLASSPCLNLYYHPWEFADLQPYRLPRYAKQMDGTALLGRLERYVRWLRPRGNFVTFAEFDAQFRGAATSGGGGVGKSSGET